jgi:hypothetical protein
MKLTKEQLKQIIKEELESLEELSMGPVAGSVGGHTEPTPRKTAHETALEEKEKLHQKVVSGKDLTPRERKKYFWLIRKLEGEL